MTTSSFDRKLLRYAKMKRDLAALEREIKREAAEQARAAGLLANPRIETLMQRIAA